MKREIKFRAWNGKDFELFDSMYDLQKANKTKEEIENLVFEQFTGLRDKNGKEIYEGDIIASEDEPIFIVTWVKSLTGFNPFNSYDSDCCIYYNKEECRVIGNIHENPELLK